MTNTLAYYGAQLSEAINRCRQEKGPYVVVDLMSVDLYHIDLLPPHHNQHNAKIAALGKSVMLYNVPSLLLAC